MLRDELLEFVGHFAFAATGETRLDPIGDSAEAKSFEPGPLLAHERRLANEPRQRDRCSDLALSLRLKGRQRDKRSSGAGTRDRLRGRSALVEELSAGTARRCDRRRPEQRARRRDAYGKTDG